MSFNATYPYNLPELPPVIDQFDQDLVRALIAARAELAELNGYSYRMPNPMLLLSPTMLRESVASSSIENINTTVAEVLESQLFPEGERRTSNKEVLRYNDAILAGNQMLSQLPISERIVTRIHHTLLWGQSSGFRQVQNIITNTKTQEVIYTPPSAATITSLINDWVKFVNDDSSDLDPLLKTAIAHYQFEAIHPFLDGNGRAGRILMVLMLRQYNILSLPILFISGYIEKNRSRYYELLLGVTKDNNWKDFLLFMIRGFREQGNSTKQTLFQISDLFEGMCSDMKEAYPKTYSHELVEALFTFPIITPAKLSEVLSIHRTTASRYLTTLAKGKLLNDRIVGKYHLFTNQKLLALING